MRQIILSDGWRLKQRDPARTLDDDLHADDGWLPASAPGTVHQDLIAAGKLPDPFDGLNERAAQWVGECDWIYRCEFELPPGFADGASVALCCDGLDTFATVWLNGAQLLSSDNMFVPLRADATDRLRPGRNDLVVVFESALRRGREREREGGVMPLWNGDSSRLYVRKAQYHYGWDWGPTLLTAGPWRPVRLEAFRARIADLHCPASVAEDLHSATLPVRVELEVGGTADPTAAASVLDDATVRIELFDPDGQIVAGATLPAEGTVVEAELAISAPQLWWPNGYGPRPFYRLAATLSSGPATSEAARLDRREVRLGLRRLRLLQQPIVGEEGTSFLFEVNNTPIFCGGANWIPADSFLPRIKPARYRALVQQCADAHMTMLRVWGGGIYEDEAFYQACDELGLLVWQDFMFGCGLYPAPDWLQRSVRAEADAQLRRLRHHPSIALWCGNNEDHMLAASQDRYIIGKSPEENADRFPARLIYERLLPAICAALDPTRPYWPGSPFGGADPNDPTVGDRHSWDVWHGQVAPYQQYARFAARFVSEFGMQALPDRATIESFAPPAERYPQSRTLDHHNKATDGPRRLAVYLNDNVRIADDLDHHIYATQFIQSEALAYALRSWRRRWGGPGRYATAGALVWQINDCWPVTSWAMVDYYLRPKPALYTVRRELAPLAVGLARAGDGTDLWVVNGTTAAVSSEVELRSWTLGGDMVALERFATELAPNRATELGQLGFDPGQSLVFDARLIVDGRVAARAALWPEPFKYLALPDPVIVLDLVGPETLRLRAMRPAKGVLLSAGDGVAWSDNMLDLMPGDEREIEARGLGERPVSLRWLGMA